MKQPGLRGLGVTHCFLLMGFCVTGLMQNSLWATLNQNPTSVNHLVGQSVKISCVVKGQSMERLEIFWYRKTEKNGSMEFIISARSSIGKASYGTNINPGKFTVTKDPLHSYSTLTITNLGHSDTGVYYCMAGSAMEYTFGDGTKLSVVDFLPTTARPATKKPPCKCKKQKTAKTSPPGVSCSAVVWAPLAGLALMLLIGLYLLASHTYRVYRRTHMYFRKYSPPK